MENFVRQYIIDQIAYTQRIMVDMLNDTDLFARVEGAVTACVRSIRAGGKILRQRRFAVHGDPVLRFGQARSSNRDRQRQSRDATRKRPSRRFTEEANGRGRSHLMVRIQVIAAHLS